MISFKQNKQKKANPAKASISAAVNANKTAGRHVPQWVNDLRYGESISLELFKRNAWLVILFMVAMIALMGLRYKTKTKMREINRLNNELLEARSEMLMEKAEYMSLVRESEMQNLVNQKGLGLSFQEQPPYRVPVDSE